MHYHVEVVIPEKGDVHNLIDEAMDPFNEEREGLRSGFAWDWYMIGGRWKGVHVPGYDADKDETHKITCNLCHGTGVRKDMIIKGGCNGCSGTGIATIWPTQWKPHEKDVIPISETPDVLICYCLIVNGRVYDTEMWTGKGFEKTGFDGKVKPMLRKLKIKTGRLVTVDAHC